MTQKKPDARQKLILAALRLAPTHNWDALTLEQIAKVAKVPLLQAKKIFADTNAILPALVTYTDDQVVAAIGKPLARGTAHDRLFEVMMARFDILQKHRKAILRIMASVKRDPSFARSVLPAEVKAMQKMLALAGLQQEGVKELLATAGLLAVYGVCLHCWERDDTADMARTMATVDRHLRRADKAAEILFRTF